MLATPPPGARLLRLRRIAYRYHIHTGDGLRVSRELRYLLLGVLVGASLSLAGGLVWLLREPRARNFDQCVLENVKAGMSDQAATLVFLSCRNLFPAGPAPSAPAPAKPAAELLGTLSELPAAPTQSSLAPAATVYRVPPRHPAAPGAALRIEFEFTQECWIELVIDGQRRISELHAPGESLQIDAERSVVLANIGNAAGVQLQVNGEPFPLPTDGQIVRDVRIELAPARS